MTVNAQLILLVANPQVQTVSRLQVLVLPTPLLRVQQNYLLGAAVPGGFLRPDNKIKGTN